MKLPSKKSFFDAISGCTIGAILGVGILIILVLAVPRLLRWIDVQNQRNVWENHQLNNFEITVISFGLGDFGGDLVTGRYLVQDGQIAAVYNFPSPSQRIEVEDADFDVIDALFDLALECLWTCSVDYEETYGFPTRIRAGWIESSAIQVKNFHPATSEN